MWIRLAALASSVEAHLYARNSHRQTELLYAHDKGIFSLITELTEGTLTDPEADKLEHSWDCTKCECEFKETSLPPLDLDEFQS